MIDLYMHTNPKKSCVKFVRLYYKTYKVLALEGRHDGLKPYFFTRLPKRGRIHIRYNNIPQCESVNPRRVALHQVIL